MSSRTAVQLIAFVLLLSLPGLAGACLDAPDSYLADDNGNSPPAPDDDDATEDPWDDPIFNTDDDDSADVVPNQVGLVSFSYGFEVSSAEYWDCQRSYRWIELPEEPAGGCANCLTTWRVRYELNDDSCGPWGYDGDGYELSSGLDPVESYLWFTHDEGVTWLRFFGQGAIVADQFTASWTFEDECIDMDSDGKCDPGSEMRYRELFQINL